MTSPTSIADALRNDADGSYCLEAAAGLFITQTWLHRPDFTRHFLTKPVLVLGVAGRRSHFRESRGLGPT